MIWGARNLSFLMGFLSLSQEILWIRMASFSYRGVPQAFGVILGLYLLGIAVGAGWGKRYCERPGNLFRVAGAILLLAAITDFLFPWLASEGFAMGRAPGTMVLALCVTVTALLKSMIFPIAHHLGSSSSAGKVGSSVSKVYFANIAGSTLGPLITGFVMLQYLTLQQSFMLLASFTLMSSAYCWHLAGGRLSLTMIGASAVASSMLVLLLPGVMMGRLVDHTGNREGAFKAAVENRYGIIHLLEATDGGGDYVFGGNAYDGRINIDFMTDSNWISRVYMLAALQPKPRRVLVIGMSAGPWTRVLTAFPGVEKIDVVELNPGYKEITNRYSEVRDILGDPRLSLHFDDGRRWLKRHPDERYDLIVMNNTYHFRSYAGMVLSQEFLALVKRHMQPKAVLALNSTFSPDVYKTAASVFSTVYQYGNFAVVGENISLPDESEAVRRVGELRLPQGALVDLTQAAVLKRAQQNYGQFKRYDEEALSAKAGRPIEVITDQNMLTEYKYGESILGYLHIAVGK